MKDNKKLGSFGERMAARYLQRKGYRLIESNYVGRYGEVDLIVSKGNLLVFVEVKTRQTTKYGSPSEAVGYRKQEKIKMVAQEFLLSYPKESDVRFDVVEIMAETGVFGTYRIKEMNHIEQAF